MLFDGHEEEGGRHDSPVNEIFVSVLIQLSSGWSVVSGRHSFVKFVEVVARRDQPVALDYAALIS